MRREYQIKYRHDWEYCTSGLQCRYPEGGGWIEFTYEHPRSECSPERIADEVARHYYYMERGCEDVWPKMFFIYVDGKTIGLWHADYELVAQFASDRVEEEE